MVDYRKYVTIEQKKKVDMEFKSEEYSYST